MSKKLSQVSVALMFSPPVINGKFQCLLLKKPLKHSEKESKYFFSSSLLLLLLLYFESWTFDGVESIESNSR